MRGRKNLAFLRGDASRGMSRRDVLRLVGVGLGHRLKGSLGPVPLSREFVLQGDPSLGI